MKRRAEFQLEQRPKSGLDCLMCAIFAQPLTWTDVFVVTTPLKSLPLLDAAGLARLNLRTTTPQKCAAVPKRARI